jgi:hypothetical protein
MKWPEQSDRPPWRGRFGERLSSRLGGRVMRAASDLWLARLGIECLVPGRCPQRPGLGRCPHRRARPYRFTPGDVPLALAEAMRRREFIAFLGGIAVARPRAVRAEQPDRMRCQIARYVRGELAG